MRSSTQLYVFGKGRGETTVYATGPNGRVVYAANVRVGNNLSSVGEMLHLAMPEANIQATPMNNLVLLTGTVASPTDVEEAQRLVQAYVGEGTQVVSRLRSAVPLQVNLKVRIAEVNRSLIKQIGVNLLTSDSTGGSQFGIGQRQPGTRSPADGTVDIPDHRRRHHPGSGRQAARARPVRLARPCRDRRPGHHPGRAEPDRAFGRNRQLPGRRRVPDPGVAGARLGLDRI